MTKYKYTTETLAKAVADSFSIAAVLRELGIPLAGGSQSHIKRRIINAGIDISHFTGQGHMKGKQAAKRLAPEDILVLEEANKWKTKTVHLRRALLDIGRLHICEGCGIGSEYNGKPIVLEIDHINGRNYDNRAPNLRFLCPNCHSQQTNGKPWKNK